MMINFNIRKALSQKGIIVLMNTEFKRKKEFICNRKQDISDTSFLSQPAPTQHNASSK